MDLVQIYTYFSGDNCDEHLYKHVDEMVEERGNSQAAENLLRNLLEVHCKMRYKGKDNIKNVLAPLLNIP